ncbi:Middle domain of eukaryotic initiation factor 4G (eIF4G) [Fragilaria crotonensis]|nr:Middle domain of eukaryotic initiation factor 4G (eIF4G) [Fragilaria crotonensis]
MPAGAWGQKPSDAIRAPPTQASQAPKPAGNTSSAGGRSNTSGNSNNTNNKQQNRHGRGGGRGGGTGGGGRGRGRGHHNTNQNQTQNQSQHYHRSVLNVDLLIPGEGSTALQKKVKRFTASDVSKVRRQPSVVDTAPPLEECKPLQVNDDTRWKSKVFVNPDVTSDDAAAAEVLDDQQVLKKALLILNKLSLTKFDKLSQEFVDTGIGRNPTTLSGAVNMIVDKAQSEPHFSSMYAQLCLFLTKVPMEGAGGRKAFKKLLLSRCQAEFEDEMSSKIAKAIKGIDDPEEQAYHEGIIKKVSWAYAIYW